MKRSKHIMPESGKRSTEKHLAEFLARMELAYQRGLLTPFIGAGMSVPECPLWEEFVDRLEQAHGERPVQTDDGGSVPLVQRAADAVRKLRYRRTHGLRDGVKKALSTGLVTNLPQTTALALLHWPLVLTTNYDDYFMAAVARRRQHSRRKEEQTAAPLVLVGREPADCQRVLASLRQPDDSLLWVLQGYAGGQAQDSPIEDDPYYEQRRRSLESELVVGHREYRRVAMASQHFRRTFAEVFRSRSLLFLGTSLSDQYFLDLFSEIVELYGPSPYPHFAFVSTNSVNAPFLEQHFGVWVHELADVSKELPSCLTRLAKSVRARLSRQTHWAFKGETHSTEVDLAKKPELQIVRGSLPETVNPDEVIVFSTGGSRGRIKISSAGTKLLKAARHGHREDDFATIQLTSFQDGGFRVPMRKHRVGQYFVVNARIDPWTIDGARFYPRDPTKKPIGSERPKNANGRERRDLRLLSDAVEQLLDLAAQERVEHVHSMLLASGQLRTFPQSASLQEMVRGWARWRTKTGIGAPRLSIYVMAEEVLFDLDSGRINTAVCLQSETFQFWLKIVERRGHEERYLCTEAANTSIRSVLQRFDVTRSEWHVEISPTPALLWDNWTVGHLEVWEDWRGGEKLTLDRFGVRTGTTLRIGARRSTDAA